MTTGATQRPILLSAPMRPTGHDHRCIVRALAVLAIFASCSRLQAAREDPHALGQPMSSDASVGRLDVRAEPGPCQSDSDCETGYLCACQAPRCALDPTFTTQVGPASGHCFGALARRTTKLPVRTDGGWTIEGHPKGSVYSSADEAWSDPWRLEP